MISSSELRQIKCSFGGWSLLARQMKTIVRIDECERTEDVLIALQQHVAFLKTITFFSIFECQIILTTYLFYLLLTSFISHDRGKENHGEKDWLLYLGNTSV